MKYDIAVIGSGPGGYVAAIRATQLGKSCVVIEKESLGGICLNWGCIPTKSLLRSAAMLSEIKHCAQYGISVGDISVDFGAIIARSRGASDTMSKGVKFLLDKAGVTIVNGRGKIIEPGKIEVCSGEESTVVEADNIIIATGARARELPNIPIDEERIISYRKALTLDALPQSMVVMGSGAIGSELAHFYHTLGCKVTLIEYMPTIMPNEDGEVSKYMERMMRKSRLSYMTSTEVTKVETTEQGCKVHIKNNKGESIIDCDITLSAVGVVANIENIGLEELGIECQRGRIVVDGSGKTSVDGIYAIGDVTPGYQLAHVASAEAIHAVESICGLETKPLNYHSTPRCVYTTPEVASVGITEEQAKKDGIEVRIGKFPFTASGKATVAGARDGFIKLIFDKESDKLLGAHFVGEHVTEMISEMVVTMNLGGTAKELIGSIHPHPSFSEAIMEAAAAAHQEAIHI